MSTSTKRRNHRNNRPESSLFVEEPKQPAWMQFPEPERQEARRLITRMLMALVAKDDRLSPGKGDDHE